MAYSVFEEHGCKLVVGSVPISDLVALMSSFAPGAVMVPTSIARRYGASMGFGSPPDVEELAKHAPALSISGAGHLSAGAQAWLATGERGMSSNALFEKLTGYPAVDRRARPGDFKAHPHDPDDLRRCRLLLEQAPELKTLVPELATISPSWAALVAIWDNLCATMDSESPDWRDGRGGAPATYKLMKNALRPPA